MATDVSTESFIELDDDELNQAIAGSRQRGVYEEKAVDFIKSGKRGVQINLEGGTHANKKANSVKTGYDTAREKIETGKAEILTGMTDEDKAQLQEAAKNMKVVLRQDKVYLVRTDVSAPAAA